MSLGFLSQMWAKKSFPSVHLKVSSFFFFFCRCKGGCRTLVWTETLASCRAAEELKHGGGGSVGGSPLAPEGRLVVGGSWCRSQQWL